MTWSSAYGSATAAISLMASASCASLSGQNAELFSSPERHIGEHVTVSGVLSYEFEDFNLYPSADPYRDLIAGRCLPVGIARSDEQNLARARKWSGSRVTIQGKIEQLVGPLPEGRELISMSFCKRVGISVTKIERR